jgi:uncharacterized phage protein gp47/JayE
MADIEPTLADLNTRANAALVARVAGSTPQLPRGILPAIKVALVGGLKALYGRLNVLFGQSTPWGATGLDALRWATIWLITPRGPTAAAGTGSAVGTNGSPIPSGQALQDGLGNTYTTTADAEISAGTATLSLVASTPGSAGNQPTGSTLTFVSAPAGVGATVTLPDGLAGGTDLETWQQVKARMLDRIQSPPQGGSDADYKRWALSVAGITRAWVFPLYSGRGTVRVFVVDDNYSGPGLASDAEVAACQAYIDSVKPAGASIIVDDAVVSGITVIAAVADTVAFTIGGISSGKRAAVQAALDALFLTAVPEGSLTRQAMIGTIGDANGSFVFTLTAPAGDQTAAAGQLLKRGAITWS